MRDLYERFVTWRVVHRAGIARTMLILNLTAPLLILLLIWLGWLSQAPSGAGSTEFCGSGPYKWEC